MQNPQNFSTLAALTICVPWPVVLRRSPYVMVTLVFVKFINELILKQRMHYKLVISTLTDRLGVAYRPRRHQPPTILARYILLSDRLNQCFWMHQNNCVCTKHHTVNAYIMSIVMCMFIRKSRRRNIKNEQR
jgi:hypothetical protein